MKRKERKKKKEKGGCSLKVTQRGFTSCIADTRETDRPRCICIRYASRSVCAWLRTGWARYVPAGSVLESLHLFLIADTYERSFVQRSIARSKRWIAHRDTGIFISDARDDARSSTSLVYILATNFQNCETLAERRTRFRFQWYNFIYIYIVVFS